MSFIEIEQSIEKIGWSMPNLHSHPNYELYFLEKGERNFYIGGSLYLVKENTVVLIPPYVMHKTEGGPFSRINVDFSDDLFDTSEKELLSELGKIVVFPLKNDSGLIIKQILLTMLSTWNNPNKQDKTAIKLCLKAIIGCLFLFQTALNEVEKVIGNDCAKPETLKIIRYINQNCCKRLTISTISEQFGLSSSCLSKTFKKETGYNIGEFILNARINQAKYLLGSTKNSVNEIADKIGFSSANYFSLIFKQKTGVSPLNYKRWLKT